MSQTAQKPPKSGEIVAKTIKVDGHWWDTVFRPTAYRRGFKKLFPDAIMAALTYWVESGEPANLEDMEPE